MDNETNPLWEGLPIEVQDWLTTGGADLFDDEEDQQLLEEVRDEISSGDVRVILENQQYFDLLGKHFPIGLNRIEWGKVDGHLFFDFFEMKDRESLEYERQKELLKDNHQKFVSVLDKALDGMPRSDILWIGDACNLTLIMSKETMLNIYPTLFLSSQHSYVIPESADWCINFTLLGELYFGQSVNQTGSDNIEQVRSQ